jgi:hypothetical protein
LNLAKSATVLVMATLTLDLSEQLQAQVKSFSRWLPVILETSLLCLKSPAHRAASDFIDFLISNPSEQLVSEYQFAPYIQQRVSALLESNHLALSEIDANELDDYLRLEHMIRVLKLKLKSNPLVSV